MPTIESNTTISDINIRVSANPLIKLILNQINGNANEDMTKPVVEK
jgi:hypothetical protein